MLSIKQSNYTAMAILPITFNFTPILLPQCAPTSPPSVSLRTPFAVSFSNHIPRFKSRGKGSVLVTRAAATTSSYVFALVFPLSLLAVTIFTSIKIADKLDKDFLEDLAINQAIREADEEDEDDFSLEEIVQEPVLPRTRNRPKREV